MLLPCRAAAPGRVSVCQHPLDHLGASHDILPAALADIAPAPADLSAALTQLTDANVCRVRKTTDSPPKVSIYDVIGSSAWSIRGTLGVLYANRILRLYGWHTTSNSMDRACDGRKFSSSTQLQPSKWVMSTSIRQANGRLSLHGPSHNLNALNTQTSTSLLTAQPKNARFRSLQALGGDAEHHSPPSLPQRPSIC